VGGGGGGGEVVKVAQWLRPLTFKYCVHTCVRFAVR
jgi:hypothetical protein